MVVYDAVVLGAGGVGSAAMCYLAQRGAQVLGLDRFSPPHDRGSSHGQTRIIRQAYFEHPNYTPLLLESYRLWSELETQVERQLYHEVGVLQIGPTNGIVVPGILRAAEEHNLQVEQLMPAEIERRWPGVSVPEDLVGVLENQAGFLKVEDCIKSYLELAKHAGAELRSPVEVYGWDESVPLCIHTSEGEISTNKLVVTAGAWAGELLADLGVEFEIRRKGLFWYETKTNQYSADNGFPGFLFELPEDVFYGFPQIDEQGIKLAIHTGGQAIEDPLNIDRDVMYDEQVRIETFLRNHLPQVSPRCTKHATCMYTMTPDEHFIVDHYPQNSNVVVAAGLSGHGYKFAAVLGKALTDLTLDGKTDLPIDFLSLRRLAGE